MTSTLTCHFQRFLETFALYQDQQLDQGQFPSRKKTSRYNSIYKQEMFSRRQHWLTNLHLKPCICRTQTHITWTDHINSSTQASWMDSCYHRLATFFNNLKWLLKWQDKLPQIECSSWRILPGIHKITTHFAEIQTWNNQQQRNKWKQFSY